jgi:hypothetical protein
LIYIVRLHDEFSARRKFILSCPGVDLQKQLSS